MTRYIGCFGSMENIFDDNQKHYCFSHIGFERYVFTDIFDRYGQMCLATVVPKQVRS